MSFTRIRTFTGLSLRIMYKDLHLHPYMISTVNSSFSLTPFLSFFVKRDSAERYLFLSKSLWWLSSQFDDIVESVSILLGVIYQTISLCKRRIVLYKVTSSHGFPGPFFGFKLILIISMVCNSTTSESGCSLDLYLVRCLFCCGCFNVYLLIIV